MKIKILKYLLLVVLIVGTIYAFQSISFNNNIQPLTNSWDFAIPHQEIPEGLVSISAESCGVCHVDHYNEWKTSTHAHAWTDLQFQAELKKESSPFMCINCHIPLQNQQEYLIKGLIDGDIYQPVKEMNPHFDKKLQQEGITCASCHIRNNVIVGTTGSKLAPHKTIKDPTFLSETICISCHNANAVITPTLACTFQTGDEWKAGPYYGQKNCISCHMDTINREIMSGFGKKKTHRHFFAGSGIPKLDSLHAHMLNGLEFYPSGIKKTYSLADKIDFKFKVKNENAGHRIPTGDPERFFLIHLNLINNKGDTLITKTERIGENWEWHPRAVKLSDNNLNPLEERVYNLNYKITQKDLLILNIQVTKHRMAEEAKIYNHLGDNYPSFINIYEKQYLININE